MQRVVAAGIFVLGIGTLVHGLVPRAARPVAYGLVAWSFLVEIVGTSIGASRCPLNTSVPQHIARAPAAAVRWDGVAAVVGIGVAAAAIGALALTRRELQGA